VAQQILEHHLSLKEAEKHASPPHIRVRVDQLVGRETNVPHGLAARKDFAVP
jgi:hypothetical protein